MRCIIVKENETKKILTRLYNLLDIISRNNSFISDEFCKCRNNELAINTGITGIRLKKCRSNIPTFSHYLEISFQFESGPKLLSLLLQLESASNRDFGWLYKLFEGEPMEYREPVN